VFGKEDNNIVLLLFQPWVLLINKHTTLVLNFLAA